MVAELEFEKPLVELRRKIQELKEFMKTADVDLSAEIEKLEARLAKLENEIYANLTPWDRVQIARHPQRPTTLDYIERLFTNFLECHGDRCFGDDEAIVGGIAKYDGLPVTVIGHQRGKDTKENLRRNFGMPHPEGYRKALRLMKQAEKFSRPIICFIDTKGAYPGKAAEERGQSEAIARNLFEMAGITVLSSASSSERAEAAGRLPLASAIISICLKTRRTRSSRRKGRRRFCGKTPHWRSGRRKR
ncbi:Acetyl-coenzyme A carboxylase carboxyl transferase subunit alpha [Geobacillus sp. BCO2]|nr:Acetyl-coenzyme A carboxylase carboxyl transferase subunit alpha [Geobacillus sp. BCO2]